MKYNVLLEVPYDLDVLSEGFPSDVAWEISQLNSYWPALITPGTQVADPKKLMHCVVSSDSEDLETLIGSLIIGYSLDWDIFGIQSLYSVIPAVFNEETGELLEQSKALSVVKCNKEGIFKYLPERLDSEGLPLEKKLTWLHHYQGQAEWI